MRLPLLLPLLRILVPALLLAQSLPAQEYFSQKEEAFERAIKRNELADRMGAFEHVRGEILPEVSELAIRWLERVGEEMRDLERRIERDEKEIADELHKRVEKPRMDEGKRQQTRELVEKQLEPVRARVAKSRQRVADNREIMAALRDLLRVTFAGLKDEGLNQAAEHLVKTLRKTRQPEDQLDLVQTMALAAHPAVLAALVETVHESRYPSIRVAALDALKAHPSEAAGLAGVEGLNDEFQQVRMAAALMLREVGGKEAVGPLIERLEKDKNTRIEDEIVKTLRMITNAEFGPNAPRWRDWWKEYADSYEGRGSQGRAARYEPPRQPAAKGPERRDGRNKGGPGDFYGITTKAKDIVYILDVSGSMSVNKDRAKAKYQDNGAPVPAPAGEQRLDQAVAELKKSIAGLPSDGTFNIIFYNEKVSIWREGMQKASKKNKKEAEAWADSVKAEGATNIFDSLELAFQIAGRGTFDKYYKVGVEVIFLLSDGAPNQGRIIETIPMIEEVGRLNKLKKIQIHTIGLGSGGQGGLLRRLADENDGQFVQID